MTTTKCSSVSSNWKALAPLIKKGIVAKKDVKEQDNSPVKKELWFEVDATTLRRSEAETKLAAVDEDNVNTTAKGSVVIIDLFPPPTTSSTTASSLGKYLAMDCEMVGVGPDGADSALARVSLVNYHGQVVLDRHVKPVEKITDYRTHVSGIEPHHLVGAPCLEKVQKEVWDLIQGKILIGHSLKNDFRALLIEHPRKLIRDTSKYRPFRRISHGKSPSLKRLAKKFLGIDIQQGAHDSVDDARVAMLLYRAHKGDWENYLFRGEGKKIKQQRRINRATSFRNTDNKVCREC